MKTHRFAVKLLILVALTGLNLGRALADPVNPRELQGNGSDRGGGDMVAAIEGMFPRHVAQRIEYTFSRPHTRTPVFEQSWCFTFTGDCTVKPEKLVIQTQVELVNVPTLHYVYRQFRAYYQLDSKWHEVQTRLLPGGTVEVWNYGYCGFNTFLGMETTRRGCWTDLVYGQFLGYPQPETTQTWIENRPEPAIRTRLISTFEQLKLTLNQQADYSNITDAIAAIRSLRLLDSIRTSIFIDHTIFARDNSNDMSLFAGPSSYDGIHVQELFLERMRADQSNLLEFALSSVASDGTCDTRKYDQFLARLSAWSTGSSAYYYEINQQEQSPYGPYITQQTQFSAMGIRQQLRNEVNRRVVPYCEAQSRGHQTRVDVVLND